MAFGDSLSVLDNFNRSDESPPTGWSQVRGIDNAISVSSNTLVGPVGTAYWYWDDTTYGPACEVSIDITTEGANNDTVNVYTRLQDVGASATWDGYQAYWQLRAGADRLYIRRIDNGVLTQIGGNELTEVADGSKLGLESDADDVHTIYYDIGSGWVACTLATITDTTYQSAGYLGVGILDTFWVLDDFSGGTISAGQTINVLQVTETNLAQSLSWNPKNRLIDLIAETDLAQGVSSLKTAQVALVTETDLAQAVGADKAKALGQALETDLAQSLTSLKVKEITQAVEADLAQAIGTAKAKVIAQTIEADLAQAITWNPQTRLIGQVTETDIAQIITVLGEHIIGVNQVIETDLAQSILWSPKNRLVGQIVESDQAQSISILKTLSIGLVTETDQAQAIARIKTLLIGQVLETDFAQIISTTGEIIQSVNQVLETNLAQSILWSPKNRLVDQVVEADLAQTLTSLKTAQIGIVSETDLAQVVGIIKSRVLGQVSETDLAQALSSSKLKIITQVMETDLAQIITVLFGVAQFFRTLNLYGEHVPETAYNLQGEHIVAGTLEGEHIPETEVDIEGEV